MASTGLRSPDAEAGIAVDTSPILMTLSMQTAHHGWFRRGAAASAPKWADVLSFDLYLSWPFFNGWDVALTHGQPIPTGNAWRVVHWNSPDGMQPAPILGPDDWPT